MATFTPLADSVKFVYGSTTLTAEKDAEPFQVSEDNPTEDSRRAVGGSLKYAIIVNSTTKMAFTMNFIDAPVTQRNDMRTMQAALNSQGIGVQVFEKASDASALGTFRISRLTFKYSKKLERAKDWFDISLSLVEI